MNILILNRHSDDTLSKGYARFLTGEGHKVSSFFSLSDSPDYLSNPEDFMSRFDLAIAHPTGEDSVRLYGELRKRNDFKVLIFGVNGQSELEGRLNYATPLDSSALLRLVSQQ